MSDFGAPQPYTPEEVDNILERRTAAMGTLDIVARGGNPIAEAPRFGSVSPSVELERQWMFQTQKNQRLNTEVWNGPDYAMVSEFWKGVQDRYKAQNESELIKVPRTQEEMILQMQQLKPVVVDPTEVANMRSLLFGKINQQLKAIDPRDDVTRNPVTRAMAEWINREAEPGGVGYLVSGEQKLKEGALMSGARILAESGELLLSPFVNGIHGVHDIARQAINGLTGTDIGPLTPTNYLEGADGKLYTNGAKVPSHLDASVMLWAAATNRNIEAEAARMGRTRELALASEAGLENILSLTSRTLGGLGGVIMPAGGAMKLGAIAGRGAGTLAHKGLVALSTLRLSRGAEVSERALKIIQASGAALGAAAGNGVFEATTYGRTDGYAHSFLHGTAFALGVLMPLGFMGRRAERLLSTRAKMPAGVAHTVAKGLEGAGFGAVEAHLPDLLPSAWGFMKDPNEETWKTYTKNMAAFMLLSVASRGHGARGINIDTPGGMALAAGMFHVERSDARLKFAERVARGEATAEEMAQAPAAPEVLKELGEQSLRVSDPNLSPIERTQAGDRVTEIERQLDVQEMGVSPTPSERVVEEAQRIVEQVPGAEPRPLRQLERKPGPEAQMVQAGGNEGLVPEAVKVPGEAEKRKAERRITEMRDPLEDPRFMRLPESVRKALLAEPDAKGRRELFDILVPERRLGDRRVSDIPLEGLTPEEMSKLPLAAKKRLSPDQLKQLREYNWNRLIDPLRGEAEREVDVGAGIPLRPDLITEAEQRSDQPRKASGERYGPQSLQAPPTTQVAPTPGTKPVTARDIYSEMEGRPGRKGFRIPFTSKRIFAKPGDPVQVAIRGGKLGRPLGVFKTIENLIRTKEGRDLAVASHEWSHAMMRHALQQPGESFRQAAERMWDSLDPAQQRELDIALKDYPGAAESPGWFKFSEGFAEWHARNLLGEVGLDAKLPALSKFMREWLAAPAQAALRGQYLRLQDMLHRYNAQGSLARVEQSVVSGAAPPTETQKATQPGKLKSVLQAVNKQLFDDMADLKASTERWLKASGQDPSKVSILNDPARLHDVLAMTAGKIMEHFTLRGVNGPAGVMIPGLKSIMDSLKGREKDFQTFVVAVRSLDLYKHEKEVQLPPQDYAEAVKQLSAKHPDFGEKLKDLKRWTDSIIDYVVEAGNLSAEDGAKIKDAYIVYVPFFRAVEGPAQHAAGRGTAEKGTGLAKIEGSTYEVKDPFIALQQVMRSLIHKAHQNQVVSAMMNMSMVHEAGGMATIVPRAKVPTNHPLRELIDAIEKKVQLPGDQQHDLESIFQALRDADALNPQTITTFAQKFVPTGERSVIAFTPRWKDYEIEELVRAGANRHALEIANNKLQWLEVDARAYETLMGIDKMPQLPPRMQPILQWMQAPRDVLRFFATGIQPGFVVANLIRDAVSAPIFDRHGNFRPLGGFVKLIRGAIEYHAALPKQFLSALGRGDLRGLMKIMRGEGELGEMRKLYEELGAKSSSFWTEGRSREMIGEQMSLWQRAKAWAAEVQNWMAHPENYIRMDEFKLEYEKAKKAGKSEREARMLALEGAREITVNFARAGIAARAYNQVTPYFNAGLQGQRKLWGQLLGGGADTKTDSQRAKIQRAAMLNGIANITVPSVLLWLLNHDEEWYQDLPDWRKIGFWNMKITDDFILSLPKPFEAGVLFGSLPEIMLDHVFGKNPADVKSAMKSLVGPYLEGPGALIPAFIKPIIEVGMNKNLYTGRELTPEWIARSAPSEEQATFYTTETAKVMSKALNGILSPIEIEAIMGGYTAGTATAGMKMIDEIMQLKDHPGITTNPFVRFGRQQVHGQSDYVDRLYERSVDLDQRSDTLTPQERGERARVEAAKRRISELRKRHREGKIDQSEAERRSYEIARDALERNR